MNFTDIYEKIINQTLENLRDRNQIDFEKNAALLLSSLIKTYTESDDIANSSLYKTLEKKFDDLLHEMYKKEFINELIYICENYIDRFRKETIYESKKLYIPYALTLLYKNTYAISGYDNLETLKDMLFSIKQIKISNENEIFIYNCNFYSGLTKNETVSQVELVHLKESFIKDILNSIDNSRKLNIIKTELKTFYRIIQDLVLEERIEELNMLLEVIFNYRSHLFKQIFPNIIISLFFIIYYIVVRESEVTNEKKESVKNLFTNDIRINNVSIINYLKDFDVELLWEMYPQIYGEFSSHEWRIKRRDTMIIFDYMRKYVDEFFTYFSTYLGNSEPLILPANTFNSMSLIKMADITTFFNEEGTLKKNQKALYKEFLSLLIQDKSEEHLKSIFATSEEIHSYFGEKYIQIVKEKVLDEAKKNKIKIENSKEYIDLKKEIETQISSIPFKRIEKNFTQSKGTMELKLDTLRRKRLTSVNDTINKYTTRKILDNIIGITEETIIDYLLGADLLIEPVGKFNEYSNLGNENSLSINSKISSRNLEGNFERSVLYRLITQETEKSLLNDYGTFRRSLKSLYFDDTLISFENVNLKVQFSDLTSTEIDELADYGYEIENAKYRVSGNYNTHLIMSKEEINEYLSNSFINIEVVFEGSILINNNKIGYCIKS